VPRDASNASLGLGIDEHHSTCEFDKQQQAGDSAGGRVWRKVVLH